MKQRTTLSEHTATKQVLITRSQKHLQFDEDIFKARWHLKDVKVTKPVQKTRKPQNNISPVFQKSWLL